MSVAFGFTEEDTYELCARALERDTAGIVAWLQTHIRQHHDMHALYEFMGRVIFKTWPMALTKGAKLSDGDYWAMQVGPGAEAPAVTATQMITAALNADWDTLTPLIRAALSKPEEFHGAVAVHLIVALGDGLRAVTEADEPTAGA